MGIQINGSNDTIQADDGSLSLAGSVSYEDVTNVTSVGLSTFSSGIHIDDSITHLGDTNTKIRFPAADTITAETGGSERLRIDSSGNMGLGTASPSTPLTVQANTNAESLRLLGRSSDDRADIQFYENDASTFSGALTFATNHANLFHGSSSGELRLTANQIAFRSEIGTEHARIDSSGRLLLGTTTEGYVSADNFTVADSGNCGVTLRSGNTNLGTIAFSDATSGAAEYDGYVQYSHAFAYMALATNQQERMRIDSSGRMGLGTASPTDHGGYGGTLEISGSPGGALYLKSGSDVGQLGMNSSGLQLRTRTAKDILFTTNNTERMRIDNSGNVVIGGTTVTDSNLLNLQGSSASENIGVVFNDTNTSQIYGIQNGGSALKFFDYTASAERMRITSAGEVCMGPGNGGISSSYTQSIKISSNSGGTIYQNYNTSNHNALAFLNTALNAVGTIVTNNSSTTYNTSSDYRLKENVVDITGGIARVKQLAPKRFNFITDTDITVDGFLAHEAQAVVPEAVTGTKDEVDDDGNAVMQGIDLSKLVPLLTAALQEAIAKIETLETQNTLQQTQINDLITRVTALEG